MDADVELTSRIEKIISEVKDVKTLDIDVAIKEGKVKVISFIKEYADSIKNGSHLKCMVATLKYYMTIFMVSV